MFDCVVVVFLLALIRCQSFTILFFSPHYARLIDPISFSTRIDSRLDLTCMFWANNWPISWFFYSNVIQTECRRFSCHCHCAFRITYALWNDLLPSSLIKKSVFFWEKKTLLWLCSRYREAKIFYIFSFSFWYSTHRNAVVNGEQIYEDCLHQIDRTTAHAWNGRETEIVSLNYYGTIFIGQIDDMNVRRTTNEKSKKNLFATKTKAKGSFSWLFSDWHFAERLTFIMAHGSNRPIHWYLIHNYTFIYGTAERETSVFFWHLVVEAYVRSPNYRCIWHAKKERKTKFFRLCFVQCV